MSVNVIKAVMGLDLRGPVKTIAIVLAEHAHKDGRESFPSVSTIARESGYCTRTVQRSLEQLMEKAIITKTKRWTPRTSNTYRFLIDLEVTESHPSEDSEVTESHPRGDRESRQSRQRVTLTPREPLYNLLGAAEISSVDSVGISFSDNQLRAKAVRELLQEQRRIKARG
jgi:DNA-binding transcriptional MocR family regulator